MNIKKARKWLIAMAFLLVVTYAPGKAVTVYASGESISGDVNQSDSDTEEFLEESESAAASDGFGGGLTGDSESDSEGDSQSEQESSSDAASESEEEGASGESESASDEDDGSKPQSEGSSNTGNDSQNSGSSSQSGADSDDGSGNGTDSNSDSEETGMGIFTAASLARVGVGLAIGLIVAVIVGVVLTLKNKKNVEDKEADKAMQNADSWNGNGGRAASSAAGAASAQSRAAGSQSGSGDSAANAALVLPPAAAAGTPSAERGTIGTVHNIGARRNQQDTLGITESPMGLVAIVSDGMGGLADGEKVSQEAVKTMLTEAMKMTQPSIENPLYELLAAANSNVLGMLGPDMIYKSGATLLAVVCKNGWYHWVTVGDSRIYFYTNHHLIQVNSEHIHKRELILQSVNGKGDFSRINTDIQRNGLISFLGMGDLRFVEGSLNPVRLLHGDRLLLMSDGVFNTIKEQDIIQILENTANASEAAKRMEQAVLEAANPKQDNFTCIILEF